MNLIPVEYVIPDNLIAGLADREVSVWIHGVASSDDVRLEIVRMLGLPWKQVYIEHADPELVTALEGMENNQFASRRGFLHVLDSDPSRIDLPPRSLPIYLLSGRDGTGSSFEQQLRRMTMLDELRRSNVRQLIVVSIGSDWEIPSGLKDLWATGFRTRLSVVSIEPQVSEQLSAWMQESGPSPTPSIVAMPNAGFASSLVEAFNAAYRDERLTIRIRNETNAINELELADIDDPERPLLENYNVILSRDLGVTDIADLPEEAFNAFFTGGTLDWRPYAAGLPWVRNEEPWNQLQNCLRRIDTVGPSENCVTYLLSEPGAGGTTLARHLAFRAAQVGYPALLAKDIPFAPDSLALVNFLTKVKQRAENLRTIASGDRRDGDGERRVHETPWLVVFDRMHWEFKDSELRRFLLQIERSGRPVCILVVSGPIREANYYDASRFKLLSQLHHMLEQDEAVELGRHLNRFLLNYGKERPDWQWRNFQEAHSVRLIEGVAAFWITLSFWLQTQYDFTESIQEWVYGAFLKRLETPALKNAVLQIAALSTERLPMPETLLEHSTGDWPLTLLLDDRRADLSSLGLLRIADSAGNYWALAHDILGRLLINAVFYDVGERTTLGFGSARDPEHLRFLILREVSSKPALGEVGGVRYGEEFATTVFKIDPDHGRGSWAHIWSDVLEALDQMPQSLRNGSRVFRHHTAISRRRIAWLDQDVYSISDSDRVSLLERAVEDILYALQSIDRSVDEEPDVNLYNSLANAYFDLANVRAKQGASAEVLASLRRKAAEATRHAYEENPTNPYVVETHVKSLIASANEGGDDAAKHCIEALEIIYASMRSDENELRRYALTRLADIAVNILLANGSNIKQQSEPKGPADVLVRAWSTLVIPLGGKAPSSFEDVPPEVLEAVYTELNHPSGEGNAQVLKFKYLVLVVIAPFDFAGQLHVLDQLVSTDYRLSPQLRLEYALLLFQLLRSDEADREFRLLRKLWRETDIFGQVPERLRWLLQPGDHRARVVKAVAAYDLGHRSMARVQEFGRFEVPYRPQEFGVREHASGSVFSAHVSFGHNGAFLRPITARLH